MTAETLTLAALVIPVVVYLVVRFASAAYFKSKQQYESEKS